MAARFRGESAGSRPVAAKPERPLYLRYLILYSSAAAALGIPPRSNAHALACGYLDELARQHA